MNELIERYLQAVGRLLPQKRRGDIIAEMRSSLYDTLEGQPPEKERAATIALLEKMGPPAQVAAAYDPAGSYLIGPALFPTFKLVLGIVFCAVIGAQLLAILLSVVLAGAGIDPLQMVGDIVGGLPTALGMVVLVFWVLQRLEVDVTHAEQFDPTRLPELDKESRSVDRFGLLLGILISVAFLTFLTQFALQGKFAWVNGQNWYENPVIHRYFPVMALSLLVAIVVDVALLLYGRWSLGMRLATIGSKLFSLVVLLLLVVGHNAWFAAAGLPGLFEGLTALPTLVESGGQIAAMGMWAFRLAFVVAAVVTALELIGLMIRLVRPSRIITEFVPARS
ncbi:MAG: hypothetical protein KDE59_07085 [Anaerolineales bacterium]|nr:hypothetical protein [Anaerolineales bacterium]